MVHYKNTYKKLNSLNIQLVSEPSSGTNIYNFFNWTEILCVTVGVGGGLVGSRWGIGRGEPTLHPSTPTVAHNVKETVVPKPVGKKNW